MVQKEFTKVFINGYYSMLNYKVQLKISQIMHQLIKVNILLILTNKLSLEIKVSKKILKIRIINIKLLKCNLNLKKLQIKYFKINLYTLIKKIETITNNYL